MKYIVAFTALLSACTASPPSSPWLPTWEGLEDDVEAQEWSDEVLRRCRLVVQCNINEVA